MNQENEFSNFLDFGDLDFPVFGDSSNAPSNGSGENLLQDGGDNAMDTSMEGPASAGILGTAMQQMEEPGQMSGMNGFQDTFSELDIPAEYLNRQQQASQQQRHATAMPMSQPRFYGHNPVPPTPSSLEMHPNSAEYYQQMAERQQQMLYEHYRRQQAEQVGHDDISEQQGARAKKTDHRTDEFHPSGLPCRHAPRHTVPEARYCHIGRRLQPFDLSSFTSPKPSRPSFDVR